MTLNETNRFRTTLEARRNELQRGTQSRDRLTVESSADDLDRTQQANEHDFTVSSIQRDNSQMNLVNDALGRIKEGTFGICVACESVIGPKRLAAVPWAKYCISCQEAADRGGTGALPEVGMAFDHAA